jgi:hypothetical protein
MKRLILFSIFYFLFSTHQASAALLYSQSAQQDVYNGQTFVLDWFLDTEGRPINSFDLKIDFNKDVLEVIEAGSGNSLINLWIKYPTFDNQRGLIELTGGIANGVIGNQVPVFRTVFKNKTAGTASITLNPDSKILLNDGLGTSEELKFRNVLFNVYPQEFLPLQITSTSHPDQNLWYKNRDVKLSFVQKPDTEYSFSFSSNIELIPDDIANEVPEFLFYGSLPDGIYYLKVNSKVGPPASPDASQGGSAWQEAGVFRVQIDATAPEIFIPEIGSDSNIFGGRDFLSFSTLDKTSGISHYEVKSGLLGTSKVVSSPYELRRPLVGKHVAVAAIDRAGNKRVVTIEYSGLIPVWLFICLLVVLLLGALYLKYKKSQKINENISQS